MSPSGNFVSDLSPPPGVRRLPYGAQAEARPYREKKLKIHALNRVQVISMKITPLRLAALAFIAAIMMFAGSTRATAAVNIGIQVGGPPPPVVVEHPWARPYRGAVWVAGHNEWIRGRWVWVGGYYAYPPRPCAVWIGPRYRHGYYYSGYWR